MTLAVTVFPQAVYAQHTFCLLFVCVSSYMSNTKAQEKVSIEVVHPCVVCFDLGVHSYMPWCSTHVHVCSMSLTSGVQMAVRVASSVPLSRPIASLGLLFLFTLNAASNTCTECPCRSYVGARHRCQHFDSIDKV